MQERRAALYRTCQELQLISWAAVMNTRLMGWKWEVKQAHGGDGGGTNLAVDPAPVEKPLSCVGGDPWGPYARRQDKARSATVLALQAAGEAVKAMLRASFVVVVYNCVGGRMVEWAVDVVARLLVDGARC